MRGRGRRELAWPLGELAVRGLRLVTVIGCALAHLLRRRKNPQADRLMNLDEGERIRVESVGTGGTAVVQYRGAPWIACAEEGDLTPGTWIIARVDGTRLVLRSAALK